jgi:hypothetical protein
VDDHTEGVDSGVGATGAVDARGRLEEFSEGFFQAELDGDAFGLELPADVGRPVIGDGQAQADMIVLGTIRALAGACRHGRSLRREEVQVAMLSR